MGVRVFDDKLRSIKQLVAQGALKVGASYVVRGWVRRCRLQSELFFMTLHDGSCQQGLQVVASAANLSEKLRKGLQVGASVQVAGTCVQSPGKAQSLELQATHIQCIGEALNYPIQPKAHTYEYLRQIGHLRMRTATFGAVFRIRHQLQWLLHSALHKQNFYHIHTPILTAIDAEGAGHMFRATTLPITPSKSVEVSKDFFKTSAYLAVSGQLEAEAAAMALGKVYTFGPTFRAENSNTPRHLAEFWMLEPEMAFYDLSDTMDFAEQLLRAVIDALLYGGICDAELDYLEAQQQRRHKQQGTKNEGLLRDQLAKVALKKGTPFARISYTTAIEMLQKAQRTGQVFDVPITQWGQDLQAEHEQFLVKTHQTPLIITDYPANLKAFYMRVNDNSPTERKTVRAMDVLLPGLGEIVGGSQREERLHVLEARMKALRMNLKTMDWYLDTRRYGSVPHSGFGLGFERLVQFVTGMDNIRDVIPFPRTPGHIEF